MVMDTLQVRMSSGLITRVDELVTGGIYANRSDVIRDAVRRLILDEHIGSLANTSNSVSDVRKIREKLSSEMINLDEINKLGQ